MHPDFESDTMFTDGDSIHIIGYNERDEWPYVHHIVNTKSSEMTSHIFDEDCNTREVILHQPKKGRVLLTWDIGEHERDYSMVLSEYSLTKKEVSPLKWT